MTNLTPKQRMEGLVDELLIHGLVKCVVSPGDQMIEADIRAAMLAMRDRCLNAVVDAIKARRGNLMWELGMLADIRDAINALDPDGEEENP